MREEKGTQKKTVVQVCGPRRLGALEWTKAAQAHYDVLETLFLRAERGEKVHTEFFDALVFLLWREVTFDIKNQTEQRP